MQCYREKFLGKIEVNDWPCWRWAGCIGTGGYGLFQVGPACRKAHRVSYELFVGPIPNGLDLDHLCRNRWCVNPSHLEPVTRRENLLRGDTFNRRNAAKTHCPKGHEFDAENTYTYKEQRHCRACQRIRDKENAPKRREYFRAYAKRRQLEETQTKKRAGCL